MNIDELSSESSKAVSSLMTAHVVTVGMQSLVEQSAWDVGVTHL